MKDNKLAISHSIYPLEYNKNNPMEGFNEWAKYIRSEVTKMGHSGEPILRHINHDLWSTMINMASLVKQAKDEVNSNR